MSDVALHDESAPVAGLSRHRRASWTGHPPADELVARIVEQVDAVVERRTEEWSAHLASFRRTMAADLERMREDHQRMLGHLNEVVVEVSAGLDGLAGVAEAAAQEHRDRLAAHVAGVLADLGPAHAGDSGWYRDPAARRGRPGLRWWDGGAWSEHTRVLTVAPHLARLRTSGQA